MYTYIFLSTSILLFLYYNTRDPFPYVFLYIQQKSPSRTADFIIPASCQSTTYVISQRLKLRLTWNIYTMTSPMSFSLFHLSFLYYSFVSKYHVIVTNRWIILLFLFFFFSYQAPLSLFHHLHSLFRSLLLFYFICFFFFHFMAPRPN